jgi:hypothetical protein
MSHLSEPSNPRSGGLLPHTANHRAGLDKLALAGDHPPALDQPNGPPYFVDLPCESEPPAQTAVGVPAQEPKENILFEAATHVSCLTPRHSDC